MNQKFGKSYNRMITVMKNYIKEAKEAKKKIRQEENDSKKDEKEMIEESMNFLITDVRRSIADLTSEFQKDMNDAEDEELQERKVNLTENMKRLEKVSEKCKEIIMFSSKNEDVICGMKDIKERYENLLSIRDIYVNQLKKEISERELEKHDLFNEAYSPHQKRTTIKIWLSVFCCSTTSATSIKVMDDYSSTSFIQAFTRFSCGVGYPKVLLPDEGSQLMKSCDTMKLNFQDIKF